MNSRGQVGNEIMGVVFVAMLALIAGGIAAGSYLFYGQDYDLRLSEAVALNYKISSCLEKYELDWTKETSALNDEFLETCELNREILDSSMLVQVFLDDVQEIKIGQGDSEICRLGEKGVEFPVCEITQLEIDEGVLTITTGSYQFSRTESASRSVLGAGGEFGGVGAGGELDE